MQKKIMIAFLVLAMALGMLLPGCKGSGIRGQQETGNNDGTTQPQETEPTEDTAQPTADQPPEDTTPNTDSTEPTQTETESLRMVVPVLPLSENVSISDEQKAAKSAYQQWLQIQMGTTVEVVWSAYHPEDYIDYLAAVAEGSLPLEPADIYIGVSLWQQQKYSEEWFVKKGVFADVSGWLADESSAYWNYLNQQLASAVKETYRNEILKKAASPMYALPVVSADGESVAYNTYITGRQNRFAHACKLLETVMTPESLRYLKQMGVPLTLESVRIPASDHDTLYIGVRNPTEDWSVTSKGDEAAFEAWLSGKMGIPVKIIHFAHDYDLALTQLRCLIHDPQSRMPDVMWGFTVLEETYKELETAGAFADLAGFFTDTETKDAYYACFKQKLTPGLLEADGYIPWKMAQNGKLYQFPWLSAQIGNGLTFHPWVSSDCKDVRQAWELLMTLQSDEGCGYLMQMGYAEAHLNCGADGCDCRKVYGSKGYGSSYIQSKDGIDWHAEYYALRNQGLI